MVSTRVEQVPVQLKQAVGRMCANRGRGEAVRVVPRAAAGESG